jgi:hypothetical protein
MTQASNVGIHTPNINSSGVLQPAGGGTGLATLTANNVLLGNGTSSVAFVAPGTTGNVLTSNGTTWSSSAPAGGGGLGGETVFTSSGTFTIPTGKTVVKVTVQGAGGGGGGIITFCCPNSYAVGAAGGGTSYKYLTGLTPGNTLTVTVGLGGTGGGSGANGGTGGTSSVASGTQTITTISATGGSPGLTNQSSPYTLPVGGTGSGADYSIAGGKGLNMGAGITGWSRFSSGGAWSTSNPSPTTTTGYGGGGAGILFSSGGSGAAGSAGIVIFEY